MAGFKLCEVTITLGQSALKTPKSGGSFKYQQISQANLFLLLHPIQTNGQILNSR